MSSRAARRAKAANLAPEPVDNNSDDDSSDDAAPPPPPKPSAFAGLMLDDDDGDSANNSDDEAPAPAPTPAPAHAKKETLSKHARKKANKKKAAAAAAEADDTPTTDAAADEELELLEESASSNERSRRAAAIATSWLVSSDTLDAEREMAKRFGAKAVRVAQREAAAEQRGQQQQFMIRGHGRGGGGRAPPTPRRVLLVQPQPEWGRPHGLIKMQTLPNERPASSDEILFAFEWSVEYRRLHQAFEVLIASSPDPNMLLELLHQEPCHIGALAQLHEVATKTGQAELAAELLHRLLWAHEASYSPGFVQAWQKGVARLHHWYPPNRPFFRALHKHAVALGRRGCVKAALSAATLLLSLDRTDPTKALLWLDLFAIRAEQPHIVWLHTLNDEETSDACAKLPGWQWSLALAYREMSVGGRPPPPAVMPAIAPVANGGGSGGSSSSSSSAATTTPWSDGGVAQLRKALLAFPGMLPACLQACAASSAAATKLAARWTTAYEGAERIVFGASGGASSNAALSHLETLYWERSAELWNKSAERVKWVQEVATTLTEELEAVVTSESGDSLPALREAREPSRRWYPPGASGNPYRGNEYSQLRAEQVVIPEEEQPMPGGGGGGPAPMPEPPEPEVELEPPQEPDGGEGSGEAAAAGDDAAVLAPLLEEAQALTTRVEELERLTHKGCAPAMKSLVTQRLATSDERLTLLMIAVDGANVSDREAKRELTRRCDALGERLARIAVD